MDKYEYNIKYEQLKNLYAAEEYDTAATMADTVNWSKVKNVNALMKVADIYEKVGRFEDARTMLVFAYDRSPIGRMIVYRLAEIEIRLGDYNKAESYYKEFIEIAPNDNLKYALRYMIRRGQGADCKELIAILTKYKEQEYTEEWAYELASVYAEAGQIDASVETCDELILWFGDGEYVEKALELKKKYQPLTKDQEKKYKEFCLQKDKKTENTAQIGEKAADDAIDIPQITASVDKYSTVNLQEEIAKGIQQILDATEQGEVSDKMESIKKMVEDLPYVQVKRDETIQMPHIESDEEIDQDLKNNFEDRLNDESSKSHDDFLQKQITGQLSIDDVLQNWERTKNVAEMTMREAEQKKLESAKARAVQEAEGIMQSLSDVQDKLDAGILPEEIIKQEKEKAASDDLIDESDMKSYFEDELKKLDREKVPKLQDLEDDLPELSMPEADPEEDFEEAVDQTPAKEEYFGEAADPTPVKEEYFGEAADPTPVKEEYFGEAADPTPVEEEIFGEPAAAMPGEAEETEEVSSQPEIVEVPEEILPQPKAVEVPEEVSPQPEAVEVPEEISSLPEEYFEEAADLTPAKADFEVAADPNQYGEEISEEPQDAPHEEEDPEEMQGDMEQSSDETAEKVDKYPPVKEGLVASITRKLPKINIAEMMQEIDTPEGKAAVSNASENLQSLDQTEAEELEPFRSERTKAPNNYVPVLEKLTDEMKKTFSYFMTIKGMDEQLCDVINYLSLRLNSENEIKSAGLIIQGEAGCGKTVLATSIIKVTQKYCGYPTGKVGKIEAATMNRKDVHQLYRKITGGCLIIEDAGDLDMKTQVAISLMMEHDTEGTLVILEDHSRGIRKCLSQDAGFATKFTSKVRIPIFTNDELVSFARYYSSEIGYKIDEMAILALYNRISNIQRLDQATTLSEIKLIVDEAIRKEAKWGLRKYFRILTAKRYTEDDRIVLTEKDFSAKK